MEPKTNGTRKTLSSQLKARAQALLKDRHALPIWTQEAAIRRGLRDDNVLLLVGETGSGKSTQVPQMLLDEPWFPSTDEGSCVAVTQPRRVAAITLARRVAEEVGSPVGSKVGYSVRFDHCADPTTRIKYLTEGMLLQEMLRDPQLLQYSVVVVDEVHERGVNADLVLGFLKRLLRDNTRPRPLKVVVMSATAEVDLLVNFFSANEDHPDTNDEWSGFSDTEASLDEKGSRISVCHVEGRQFPVSVHYAVTPVQDYVDAALRAIFQIHHKEPLPGDILVFLTGQEVVESLEKMINELAGGLGPDLPRLLVLPLFAALPQQAQQRVFQPAAAKTRKVILATNIAETSVTVSGVRFVVDCGKSKQKHFRTNIGLESLLVRPISKSAAIQRKGRAGREAPGHCYRLYTESAYLSLIDAPVPEILRCDLASALLTMKARGVDDIFAFPFLSPPPSDSLEKALLLLLRLSALCGDGTISIMGQKMALMPLPAQLARMLLAAVELECVEPVIDIIACLSTENVFLPLTSDSAREAAGPARKELFRREGDHLTLLAAVEGYLAEETDRKAWCNKYWISHRAMRNVMDVRKQLRTLQKQAFEVHTASPEAILKSLLAGFAMNTARLIPDGSYRTLVGNQIVAIHPSSVLFGATKLECICYNEYVFTNKAYARGVSAVQMDWIEAIL